MTQPDTLRGFITVAGKAVDQEGPGELEFSSRSQVSSVQFWCGQEEVRPVVRVAGSLAVGGGGVHWT
ncbi:unnamed protein product, partial [Gulo gulo]